MHQHRILLLLSLLGLALFPPLINAWLYKGPVWLPFTIWGMVILLAALHASSGGKHDA